MTYGTALELVESVLVQTYWSDIYRSPITVRTKFEKHPFCRDLSHHADFCKKHSFITSHNLSNELLNLQLLKLHLGAPQMKKTFVSKFYPSNCRNILRKYSGRNFDLHSQLSVISINDYQKFRTRSTICTEATFCAFIRTIWTKVIFATQCVATKVASAPLYCNRGLPKTIRLVVWGKKRSATMGNSVVTTDVFFGENVSPEIETCERRL